MDPKLLSVDFKYWKHKIKNTDRSKYFKRRIERKEEYIEYIKDELQEWIEGYDANDPDKYNQSL